LRRKVSLQGQIKSTDMYRKTVPRGVVRQPRMLDLQVVSTGTLTTLWVKKLLLPAFSPNAADLKILSPTKNSKFVMNLMLRIQPNFQRVATLPCDISGIFLTLANYPFFAPFDIALDMYPARILLEIIAKLNDAVMHTRWPLVTESKGEEIPTRWCSNTFNKNSSGDEIANVNFFTTHRPAPTPTEPTS